LLQTLEQLRHRANTGAMISIDRAAKRAAIPFFERCCKLCPFVFHWAEKEGLEPIDREQPLRDRIEREDVFGIAGFPGNCREDRPHLPWLMPRIGAISHSDFAGAAHSTHSLCLPVRKAQARASSRALAAPHF
jgi:hypothetical protein